MCKEVDNDSNDTNNSSKAKTRDVKVLPVTENPVTIPENNQFSHPKHKTSYVNNELKINNDEIDDISLSSLEGSNKVSRKSSTTDEESISTVDESNSSSNSIDSQKNGTKGENIKQSNSKVTKENSETSSNGYSASTSDLDDEDDESVSESSSS